MPLLTFRLPKLVFDEIITLYEKDLPFVSQPQISHASIHSITIPYLKSFTLYPMTSFCSTLPKCHNQSTFLK